MTSHSRIFPQERNLTKHTRIIYEFVWLGGGTTFESLSDQSCVARPEHNIWTGQTLCSCRVESNLIPEKQDRSRASKLNLFLNQVRQVINFDSVCMPSATSFQSFSNAGRNSLEWRKISRYKITNTNFFTWKWGYSVWTSFWFPENLGNT